MSRFHHALVVGAILVSVFPSLARAGHFEQFNLVSSVSGLAPQTDPNLKNPWGVALSPTGPFWVANQVTRTATIYNGDGVPNSLVVAVPSADSGGPTGQVFNPTSDFTVAPGNAALFLLANLDGSISGWHPSQPTNAIVCVSTPGAAFTGLALGNNGSGNFLYAADAAGAQIRVYDANFSQTNLSGSFTDPNLPAGFTPYNIQNLGGTLYVTYENEGAGGGVINAFDMDGAFLRRVSSNADGGPLDAPWGLALAPDGFGPFAGALLVGNEHDGHISAYNPLTGEFLGQLLDEQNNPIANTGLWGLTFGNDANGGDSDDLYFAAGIEDETEGLFGEIEFVPEPATLLLAGLLCVGLIQRR